MYFYQVRKIKDFLITTSTDFSFSICRYAYGKFSNSHEATIGGCFLTKNEDLGDYIVKYEMWDTAGQERYRSLAQMYYKNAIGACVVFDVTSRDSFEKC